MTMLGVQTFVLVLYVSNLAVIPGYGSRAECEAAQRVVIESMRKDGLRQVLAFCVTGPVEVR